MFVDEVLKVVEDALDSTFREQLGVVPEQHIQVVLDPRLQAFENERFQKFHGQATFLAGPFLHHGNDKGFLPSQGSRSDLRSP